MESGLYIIVIIFCQVVADKREREAPSCFQVDVKMKLILFSQRKGILASPFQSPFSD